MSFSHSNFLPASLESSNTALRIFNERNNVALIQQDKGWRSPKDYMRLFQLTNFVYADAYASLDLPNKNLLIHTLEAGNFGDVAQLFQQVNFIKFNLPDLQIKIALALETKTQAQVNNVFPLEKYDIEFVPKSFFEREEHLKKIIASRATLGVAVGIHSPLFHKSPHNVLKEYGFDFHPDTVGNTLSMGVGKNEEGVMIPEIKNEPAKAQDIQTPWLHEALGLQHHNELQNPLYMMYIHRWENQILFLYSILNLTKDNSNSLDFFIPLEYPIQSLLDWGFLQKSALEKLGVGKIISKSSTETIITEIGSGDKVIKIINGSIPKHEMEILQKLSEKVVACTGDMSWGEAVALDKLAIYEVEGHKLEFYKSICTLSENLELKNLNGFQNLIKGIDKSIDDLYVANTPKKRGGWYGDPANMREEDANSVPRKCADQISPLLEKESEKIALSLTNKNLLEESHSFNETIKQRFDVRARLLAIVKRSVIINNFPSCIEAEEKLAQHFLKGDIKIEDVFNLMKGFIKEGFNLDAFAIALQEAIDVNMHPELHSKTKSNSISQNTLFSSRTVSPVSTDISTDSSPSSSPKNKNK